jgi:hypothetical protein
MSFECTHDARVVLVREKYFSVRPKPLERWLWQQPIAPSAERVFWVHWEEGHRNGTWCSEIPIKRVASECCLDVSTVTRAYQQLAALGLIRRQDPGRDPRNPFHQATAITEVRLPRELVINLGRFPSRRARLAADTPRAQSAPAASITAPSATAPPMDPPKPRISIMKGVQILKALELKMSPREASAFAEAQRQHATHIDFDDDTKLSAEERADALTWLSRMAVQSPVTNSTATPQALTMATRRTLGIFEMARARRELTNVIGADAATETLRQIVWATEQGALKKFDARHALNIALKKVRDGQWTRPHRMPPNWVLPYRTDALHEQCRTA